MRCYDKWKYKDMLNRVQRLVWLKMRMMGSKNKTMFDIETLRRPKIRIIIVSIQDAKQSGIKILEDQ